MLQFTDANLTLTSMQLTRHIHNGLFHGSTHHLVCPSSADWIRGLTSYYRHRGLRSCPTLVIFILIIIGFTGATIHWATYMAGVAIRIHLSLVKNIGMELSEKFAPANAAIAKLKTIQAFIDPFMVL